MFKSPVAREFAEHTWYHQRFDGAPMYLSLIGEADTRPEARIPAGVEARWLTCYYKQGTADGFLDMADISRGAAILTKLVEQDAGYGAKLMAAWREDEEAFERYYALFDRAPLTGLSDEELAAEFEKFRSLAVNRLTSTCIIDHFALGTDEQLSQLLRQETGIQDEAELNRIFSVATAPVHRSFINEAEIALLHIAVQVQQGADLHSEDIQRQVAEHQRHWFWLNNNYVRSEVLPVAYFEEEISAWLQSGRNLAEQEREFGEKPAKNRQAKEELFERVHFSAGLRGLLTMSENLTRWQDERKRATYLAIYLGSCLLEEMGRRRQVDAELLKYLAPAEVSDWFLQGTVSAAELEKRVQGCFLIWENDKTRVYVGEEAEEIREAAEKPTETAASFDIRGLVACTGVAMGRARIVMSSSEMGKVQEGDILIAVMTRPDYVPAMKKAAAIVTNEGGITCHAAIVSRELGIPCIIGTKIATKVFRDGDLIEVNANHNWVRKIKERETA